MKLDNIVYDISTLNTALTSALVSESPTFNAMYPSETATSLVNTLSGVGSMLQYTLVSAMANAYTDSAYSPSGIYQLAETLGNKLHGNTAARIICDISRTTTLGTNVIIPKESVFEVDGVKFFNKYAISFAPNVHRVNDVTLIQGKIVEVELTTSGIAGEKLYFSEGFRADPENIQVFVNGEEWEVADSFIQYDSSYVIDASELKVVVYRTNASGQAYIKLGNGQSGLLPQANTVIKVRYVDNEGLNGNISKSNLDIQLKTNIFNNNNTLLEVTFPKTSTSYGGSNSQSLDVLKESSPYVFASGNRCIRRSDYYSMLLNKCGYISASVWGEYEEAQFYGTYDKIMMNMVYYTGIKNFTIHDYKVIGPLTDEHHFEGNLKTTKAFPGSVNFKLLYAEDQTNEILYEDNGGKGLLFNNNDNQFTIDNFEDSWRQGKATINLVKESDSTEGRDIVNVINNVTTLDLYYESGHVPTYADPVQIRLDFTEPTSIAGFKFFIPAGDITFTRNAIGSFAVFGTNDEITHVVEGVDTLNTNMYVNVRNKTNIWTRVVNRSTFVTPTVGNWSNWIATNLYNPKQANPENQWTKYKHYLIEVYNVQDSSSSTVKIGKLKVLYNEVEQGTEYVSQISTVDYENNCEANIYIPSVDTLGGFYTYDYEVNNLKRWDPETETGVSVGEVLHWDYPTGKYVYSINPHFDDTQGYSIGDIIKILDNNNNDTGLRYEITNAESVTGKVLEGRLLETSEFGYTEYNSEAEHPFPSEIDSKATVDLTILSDVEGTIISTQSSTVSGVDFQNPTGLTFDVSSTDVKIIFKVTVGRALEDENDNGTNNFLYKVDITDDYYRLNKEPIEQTDCPLLRLDNTDSGATISVSDSYGVTVSGAFVGDKIEQDEVAMIDQTIIEQYNHFTTYLEFRQPEVIQAHIHARVKYKSDAVIEETKQLIHENVNKLFDIHPSYLGQDLKLSDLYNAIRDTDGVDYVLIDTPTTNVVALPYQFVVLSSLEIEDEI